MKSIVMILLSSLSLACATQGPCDSQATESTQQLYQKLVSLQGQGVLFGHQDTLAYGMGWKGAEFESDVHRVCGQFPALFGWDVGHIGEPNNIDGVPFVRMQQWIKLAHARGGINTISWHIRVPGTHENSWTRRPVVKTILPGGEHNADYLVKLDALAEFIGDLRDEQGRLIPVIFRPYHEHMGSWFWWGRDHCTAQEYKALFQFTVDYLRQVKGLHNLLICYSPNSFPSKEYYLERYPGDAYVDILGLDHYFNTQDKGIHKKFQSMATLLAALGRDKGKLIAFSETGLETLPDAHWWTEFLLRNLKASAATRQLSYVMVWRNGRPDHYYAPYPGQASAEDFKTFAADPWTLFMESPAEADDFVRVEGMHFMRGDRPYYFCGTNFWYGCYLGASEEGRQRLVQELDQLQALGVTNLRVLGASEESAIERSVSPAIQAADGTLNESLLKGLDVLLAEMARRDMTAVIYLNNYWEWSGGMSTYMSWFSDDPLIDPGATGRWVEFMAYSAKFYRNAEGQNRYRQYIATILNRTNTVTGRLYKNDPTIMAWELANEPRPGADGDNGKLHRGIFLNWIHGIAAYIKSLDGNHLVSTGSEGLWGCLNDEDLFLKTHGGPVIDYASMHLWPKNWGWFKAERIDETLPSTLDKATAYIKRHIALAQKLGKPVVLGEYGMERDGGVLMPGTATTARDRFLKHVYGLAYANADAGGPLVGTNVWAWGGQGRAQREDGWWQPGDPFTGDPPQEHQGLNSIFATDKTTHAIIKAHSRSMQALNREFSQAVDAPRQPFWRWCPGWP